MVGGSRGPVPAMDPQGFPAIGTGCLANGKCHAGIEPIRAHNSGMAQQIYRLGNQVGDPNGCVVCHGGNPKEEVDKTLAHQGAPAANKLQVFTRHAASMWVNDKTCGQCHQQWVYAGNRSLMQTEAGKIQGALWGWGPASTGYEKKYGNYAIDDPDGPIPVFGSERYKKYMQQLMKEFPHNFPSELKRLPEVDLNTLADHPEQAVYTYLRSESPAPPSCDCAKRN